MGEVPRDSQREAIGESLAQLNQETIVVLEKPVPWNDHQEWQKPWSKVRCIPKDNFCVLQRAEKEKRPSPLEDPRRWRLSPRYWTPIYLYRQIIKI